MFDCFFLEKPLNSDIQKTIFDELLNESKNLLNPEITTQVTEQHRQVSNENVQRNLEIRPNLLDPRLNKSSNQTANNRNEPISNFFTFFFIIFILCFNVYFTGLEARKQNILKLGTVKIVRKDLPQINSTDQTGIYKKLNLYIF